MGLVGMSWDSLGLVGMSWDSLGLVGMSWDMLHVSCECPAGAEGKQEADVTAH